MKKVLGCALVVVALQGCSVLNSWVYRMDIPQGNYLEQRDIDKLRIGMSKEQVQFVLGDAVASSAFSEDTWYYLYKLNPGQGEPFRRQLVLEFDDSKLLSMTGDFDKPEMFDTPLDQ